MHKSETAYSTAYDGSKSNNLITIIIYTILKFTFTDTH